MSSYSFGAPIKTVIIGKAGAAQNAPPPLIVTRKTDASSGTFQTACPNGTHFSSMRFTNGATTIVVENAVIVRFSGSKAGTETLTLKYGKVETPKL
jgi:type VI protein secretion system component Hcp